MGVTGRLFSWQGSKLSQAHCPLQTPAFRRMLSCGPQRREKALFEGHKHRPSATQGHGPWWGERGTRLPKTPSRGLGSPRLPRKGRGGGVVPPAAGGAMRLLEHTTRVPSSERGELTARGEDMGRLRPERGQASAQRRASNTDASKRVDVPWTDTAATRGR